MLEKSPAFQKDAIIILLIEKNVYSFTRIRDDFFILFCSTRCPACQFIGTLRRHAHYQKYYYRERIYILRCICAICRVTHAIIPSFSLPGTSIGTTDVEQYLILRYQGKGRRSAGKTLVHLKGMSEGHPRALEQGCQVMFKRAKALLAGHGDDLLSGLEWVNSLVRDPSTPLLSLNLYCLQHRLNAVCLTRFPIHTFPPRCAGIRPPLNSASPSLPPQAIDSG